MSDIKNIHNDYSAKLNNNLSLEEINQIKTELFGKKWFDFLSIQKYWINTRGR
jgi:hypothetical protein